MNEDKTKTKCQRTRLGKGVTVDSHSIEIAEQWINWAKDRILREARIYDSIHLNMKYVKFGLPLTLQEMKYR